MGTEGRTVGSEACPRFWAYSTWFPPPRLTPALPGPGRSPAGFTALMTALSAQGHLQQVGALAEPPPLVGWAFHRLKASYLCEHSLLAAQVSSPGSFQCHPSKCIPANLRPAFPLTCPASVSVVSSSLLVITCALGSGSSSLGFPKLESCGECWELWQWFPRHMGSQQVFLKKKKKMGEIKPASLILHNI